MQERIASAAARARESAVDVAYEGILERMTFTLQRRINLASGIGDITIKGATLWLVAIGTARSLPADYKAAISILDAVFVYLPLFGMLMCVIYMAIARSIYQDEVNYICKGLEYEVENTDGYGVAHVRYDEIVEASYWRPSTTEVSGFAWFCLWFAFALISRYYGA
jgi:hypothetical protein